MNGAVSRKRVLSGKAKKYYIYQNTHKTFSTMKIIMYEMIYKLTKSKMVIISVVGQEISV